MDKDTGSGPAHSLLLLHASTLATMLLQAEWRIKLLTEVDRFVHNHMKTTTHFEITFPQTRVIRVPTLPIHLFVCFPGTKTLHLHLFPPSGLRVISVIRARAVLVLHA